MATATVAFFAVAMQTAVAETDQSANNSTDAEYSTGQQGSRLKWLPYCPKTERKESNREQPPAADSKFDDPEIIVVQYLEPIAAPQADPTPGATPDSRLFSDPFGDRKQVRINDAVRGSLRGAPQPMPNEPRPANPLPGLGTKTKPYLPPSLFPNQGENGGLLKKPMELENTFNNQPILLSEKCPTAEDLKDINELTTDITPSEGDLPKDCHLGGHPFVPRSFAPITYTWTASGLCHKPLYFEDVQLERYGHMAGPWLQPFASGAHFFLTIPILPYKMGLTPPGECLYTLGYYRPGNCAPYMLDPIPLSVRGAFFEAGAWVAGVYMIP